MKSNKIDILLEFLYQGGSYTIPDTFEDFLMDCKSQISDAHNLWMDDDNWLDMPCIPYMITDLALDETTLKPTFIQLTEKFNGNPQKPI